MSIGLLLLIFVLWLFANGRFDAWKKLAMTTITPATPTTAANSILEGNTLSGIVSNLGSFGNVSIDNNVALPSGDSQGSVDITSVKLIP